MIPTRRTRLMLATVLAGAVVGVLPGPPARADGELDASAAQQHLGEVLLADEEVTERGKRVRALAKLNTKPAAFAFLESLDRLNQRTVGLEEKAAKTRAQYEPYSGFSFKDPKSWEIKKRIREQMDRQDLVLQGDGVVRHVFLASIAEFSDEDAIVALEKGASTASLPHSRRVLYGGLLRHPLTDGGKLARKAMRDSDPTVRLVVLEALGTRKDPTTIEVAIKALKEKGWPHRQAAAFALGEMKDVRAVAPLINAMGVEDGRLIEEYAEALSKIVAQDLGPNPGSWKRWFDEHKSELVAQGAGPLGAKRPKKRDTTKVNYYGVETLSRRIVFIIDISGSMKEIIGQPSARPVTGVKAADQTYEGPKIEIAKRVLKQAIRALPEETFFNIIVFNHAVRPFSSSMLQAKQDNKNKAYLMINDLRPSGATYTYGALKKTFEIAGRGVTDKGYDPGVDTIFLLSDGAPTDDDIDKAKPMDGEVILKAVKDWNGLKRVQIHTVSIDPQIGSGVFIRFMKSLAARNDGTYQEIGNK